MMVSSPSNGRIYRLCLSLMQTKTRKDPPRSHFFSCFEMTMLMMMNMRTRRCCAAAVAPPTDGNIKKKPRKHPMTSHPTGIRNSSASQRLIKIGLACLIFSQSALVVVHGFANNLVGSNSGCMTMLDPSEVIMNYEVKSAENSDFPRFHLVVVEEETGNHIESPFHYKVASSAAAEGSDNATPKTVLSVVFVNPYTPEEFRGDLQFVMEVFYGPDDDGNGGDDLSSPPAEFVGGGAIGCKHNRRVSARLMDHAGLVQLQINDVTSHLHLMAGWATEHEAVRLTPVLYLKPAPVVVAAAEANVVVPPESNRDAKGGTLKKLPPIVVDDLEETPKNVKDDSNLDAAAADAAADDDGKPVMLDDEVQEEKKEDEEEIEEEAQLEDETKKSSKKNSKQKQAKSEDFSGDSRDGGKVTTPASQKQKQQRQKPPKEPRWHEERVKVKDKEEFVAATQKFHKTREELAQLDNQHDAGVAGDSQDKLGDEDEEALPPMKGRGNLFADHKDHAEKERKQRRKVLKGSRGDETNNNINKYKKLGKSDNQGEAGEEKEEEEQNKAKSKSFRHLYESDEFAGGLHMNGYLSGCLFFVVAFGCILSLGRRREKGRRDL